eukprot:PhM_4_TR3616/c0_g1_i1/m.52733/K04986/PKD2; polycystin 2
MSNNDNDEVNQHQHQQQDKGDAQERQRPFKKRVSIETPVETIVTLPQQVSAQRRRSSGANSRSSGGSARRGSSGPKVDAATASEMLKTQQPVSLHFTASAWKMGSFGKSKAMSWRSGRRAVFNSREVPLKQVLAYLKSLTESLAMSKELLIYSVFLVSFVFFYIGGRDITANLYAQSMLKQNVIFAEFPTVPYAEAKLKQQLNQSEPVDLLPDKNFLWIEREKYLHTWLSDIYAPHVVTTNRAATSNFVQITDTRVRVIMMKPEPCSPHNELVCYPRHKRSGEMKEPRCNGRYFYTDCTVYYTVSETGSYHCGGYITRFPVNTSVAEMKEGFDELFDASCPFILTDAARFFALERTLYLPATDTHIIESIFIEMSPTGSWHQGHRINAFDIFTMEQVLWLMYRVYFLFFVLYYCVRCLSQWADDARRNDSILHFICNGWNVMEIVNLVTFIVVFVLHFSWVRSSTNYPNQIEDAQSFYLLQVYMNSINTVLSFLKLLRFLRLNNRLNILTRTLRACQGDVLGILVLFTFFHTGYSIAGNALYGDSLREFRTVSAAYSTLLRVVLGNVAVYEEMSEATVYLTPLYFWSYTLLAQFLLLNFIIAVLSHSLGDICRSTPLFPLDTMIYRYVREMRYALMPQNVRRRLSWYQRGITYEKLIQAIYTELSAHNFCLRPLERELAAASRDALDDWLTPQLSNEAGEYVLDLLWEDIVYDYDLRQRTEKAKEERDWREVARDASLPILTSFGEKLVVVDELLSRVEAVALALPLNAPKRYSKVMSARSSPAVSPRVHSTPRKAKRKNPFAPGINASSSSSGVFSSNSMVLQSVSFDVGNSPSPHQQQQHARTTTNNNNNNSSENTANNFNESETSPLVS